MKKILLLSFVLTINSIFSQNKENLIDRIRYVNVNDSLTRYNIEGFNLYRISSSSLDGTKKIKKSIKKYLKKEKFSLKDKKKINLYEYEEILKKTYQNNKGYLYSVYEYSSNSKSYILNYSSNIKNSFTTLDKVTELIITNKIPKNKQILISDDLVLFDKIKLKVEKNQSNDNIFRRGIKTITGYYYNLSYFESKVDIDNYIQKESERLLRDKAPVIHRNERYELDISNKTHIVYNLYGNHKYGSKSKGYKTIFDNILITSIETENKFLLIKAFKTKIYDKKEIGVTNEFINIIQQIKR